MVRMMRWAPPLSPTALARGLDAAIDGRVGHDASVPDGSQQVALADDAIALAQQVCQQVEHLRFDHNRFVTAVQLAPLGIQAVVAEQEAHGRASTGVGSARLRE